MKTRSWALVVAYCLLRGGSIPAAEPTLTRFEFAEPHMGTRFQIVLYATDRDQADRAARAAFVRIHELDVIMSDYRPTSEIMKLCQKNAVTAGDPVTLSPELFFVLAKGEEVSRLSDGAFDVTVGPLVKLWRRARRTQQLPAAEDLARAKALVDYRQLELDAKTRTVRFLKPGLQLDLGGIAKGYAADEALATLKGLGVTRALVAAGGDIAVSAAPPDRSGWTVAVAPLRSTSPARSLALHDAAVSTSGDAEQYTVIDGVRYSHLLDPKTGLGLTGRRSVTVIARHGITADSMTKVVSSLPPAKALDLIEQLESAAALVVVATEHEEVVRESKRFGGYLERPKQP